MRSNACSIAYIAPYAHTHVADEGGAFDFNRYPAIQENRVAQDRHVKIID
jgi:hypothetical protein